MICVHCREAGKETDPKRKKKLHKKCKAFTGDRTHCDCQHKA